MAKGFKAGVGGGAALNFKVVGNPQPASTRENTIWLNTDVPIGAWYFSATQPENLNEGDVWFPTGTSSPVEFNALKKNGIQVYPLSAKQYVGGALVNVEAKSYQGGAWVDWWNGELYEYGNEYEDITGGWTADGFSYSGATVVPSGFVKSADRMSFNGESSNVNALSIGGCKKTIDLTPYNAILLTYENKALSSGSGLSFFISTGTDIKTTKVTSVALTTPIDTVATETIPISAISGQCYISALGFNTQRGDILSVKLVR